MTDAEIVTRVREQYEASDVADGAWRETAAKCARYVKGNQWDPVDVETLRAQKRPALTINRILPQVNLAHGLFVGNALALKAVPKERSDEEAAAAVTALLADAWERNDADAECASAYDDGLTAGRGWLFCYPEFEEDLFAGEIVIRRESPFRVGFDPGGTRRDLSDAEYVFRSWWIPEAKVKLLYPGKEFSIDWDDISARTKSVETRGDGYKAQSPAQFYDAKRRRVRLIETYERRYERIVIAANKEVPFVKIFRADDAAGREAYMADLSMRLLMAGVDPAAVLSRTQYVERVRPHVHMTTVAGEQVLEDKRWWSRRYPLVPFFPHVVEDDEGVDTIGMVQNLIDPQDEVNKTRSQILHIINTSANSGWIFDRGAVDKTLLEKSGAVPGVLVDKEPGTSVERITPPPAPMGVFQVAATSSDDIREISGLNAELAGAGQRGDLSGRAIEARQRGGTTIQARYPEAFRLTRRMVGRLMVEYISLPEIYPAEKIRRILGDKAPESFDPGLGRYDVVVDDATPGPTERREQFERLTTAVEKFPALAQVLGPEEVIEVADLPNKDRILRRLEGQRAAAPPQVPPSPAGQGVGA